MPGTKKLKTKSRSESPIGIFDSGIGGLTVAHAIHKILPQESIVYFGDTAHLPYGEKSPDSIKYYGLRIAEFLLGHGCKTIVIACNTASSIAFEAIKKHVGNRATVISVIEPVVNRVAAQVADQKIGVIGTKATIKSDVYAKKINLLNPMLQVASLATPLLAPMIEEGFFNNKISKTIIHSYLDKARLKNIKTIILACTHYPLIKSEIEDFYKGKVKIIDSAQIVAESVFNHLADQGLLNTTAKPVNRFFVSDFTPSFAESTKIFFKGKLNLEHYPLWENE
jgi:glutamate racemase